MPRGGYGVKNSRDFLHPILTFFHIAELQFLRVMWNSMCNAIKIIYVSLNCG